MEGKNIVIEYRWAEGKYDRLPALVAELIQMKVDVIVAESFPCIQAAQKATRTVAIVMVRTGEPVGAGFVASLARPGGNITGLSHMNVEVSSKYLELLHLAVPKLSRVTVLTIGRPPTSTRFSRARSPVTCRSSRPRRSSS